MKKCFFIGHREANESIYPILRSAIETHIAQHNVEEFIVGQYGAFDRLVRKALVEAKQKHPDIRLVLLTPYHTAERKIELPKGFDDILYPEGLEKVPRRYAIVRANRYMIDLSDYLIAYVTHPASNAHNLFEYAKKRAEKCIFNIQNIGDYSEK